MNSAKRHAIFACLKLSQSASDYRAGILHSPFELLVAVILSAQATDKSVNLATRKIVSTGPTHQKKFLPWAKRV
jgi:endonuclease-3